jgi:hypothetical protein
MQLGITSLYRYIGLWLKEVYLEYFPEAMVSTLSQAFQDDARGRRYTGTTAMRSQKYSVGHMDHHFAKLLLLLQEVKCRNALV